ncbi:hypothetical protein GM661_12345 [Iocasia frigidifontis]|uniref:Uncharacterized protein n=1 Tax=Iocasia fonsfrigidae TaxID=2682810 RepID=A0A8A7KG70_9FIRM|nr:MULTISPECIES: hypothetical protein [Halanaerobiaceae]QTL98698.1 hypothetical protein GM661_12345 [Iocasia fonsfrigidae]
MRMKRSMYKLDKEKHRKLMKKLIDDGMSFNEFLDRIIYMYLEGKYTLD